MYDLIMVPAVAPGFAISLPTYQGNLEYKANNQIDGWNSSLRVSDMIAANAKCSSVNSQTLICDEGEDRNRPCSLLS